MQRDQEQPTHSTEEKAVEEQLQEGSNKGNTFGKLSKKNKLRTADVKKVTGGAKGGGWDANHNEVMI